MKASSYDLESLQPTTPIVTGPLEKGFIATPISTSAERTSSPYNPYRCNTDSSFSDDDHVDSDDGIGMIPNEDPRMNAHIPQSEAPVNPTIQDRLIRERSKAKRWAIVTFTLVVIICKFYSLMISLHNYAFTQIGTIFVIGNVQQDQEQQIKSNWKIWFNRISPSNMQWWYYSVLPWPQCQDVRNEGWRLISMQFAHSKSMLCFVECVCVCVTHML
jgi:hypothetical protein